MSEDEDSGGKTAGKEQNHGKNRSNGIQSFEEIRKGNCFYVDKTNFIKEWWESQDSVTLITRPRRFGKTLNMSMLETFFSVEYKDRSDLFEGLSIWKEEKYREMQGTYPVIFLSFANVKENNYEDTYAKICILLQKLYAKFIFLKDSPALTELDRAFFERILKKQEMSRTDATLSIYQLCDFLYRYYGKKPIILLDEYDTPMQEAYVHGFWDEMVAFTRSLFNSAFKTNPSLGRAIMTGITGVSKESIFSDLNNLEVITTTSEKYATAFGFTEEEVFAALEECGRSDKKEEVIFWYDGFVFGTHADIYNPWSIINFLDKGTLTTYWANTSSNGLVGKLLRESSGDIKEQFEQLLNGEVIEAPLDEQIVYNQLDQNTDAIWSLLLASGYVKALDREDEGEIEAWEMPKYQLALTNHEVVRMFYGMIGSWFKNGTTYYNDFIKALLKNDSKAMNNFMNRVALSTFSYFDTGKEPSFAEPERFYHGFVLGLMVDLQSRYSITSNRESGFGRYDVMLEPKKKDSGDYAYILEFKVHDPEDEKDLKATVAAALLQIEEKKYAESLMEKGIPAEKIQKYGFAFEGKTVLIG